MLQITGANRAKLSVAMTISGLLILVSVASVRAPRDKVERDRAGKINLPGPVESSVQASRSTCVLSVRLRLPRISLLACTNP